MEMRIHFDEQIAAEICSVLHTATQQATLVSPWIKLWGHARLAIREAIERGVKVQCLVRHEENPANRDNVKELLELGVTVLTVPDLHAKIYLNEEVVIIGSMNLYEYSAKNSRDIAVEVSDEAACKSVRDYVNRLGRRAKPWGNIPSGNRRRANMRTEREAVKLGGACIRCNQDIGFNPDKPLCEECYDIWSDWQNPDHPENFCHSCGTETATSYAKPLCLSCHSTR